MHPSFVSRPLPGSLAAALAVAAVACLAQAVWLV